MTGTIAYKSAELTITFDMLIKKDLCIVFLKMGQTKTNL